MAIKLARFTNWVIEILKDIILEVSMSEQPAVQLAEAGDVRLVLAGNEQIVQQKFRFESLEFWFDAHPS